MRSKEVRWVTLGDYIEPCDERNHNDLYNEDDVRGLATSKQIISTKANLNGVLLTSYKVLKPNEFAYVSDTSRRADKISLGFNQDNEAYIVSSISTVFRVKDENELLPDYLYLWFCRSEFDRYVRFNSWGSARETFSYDDMSRIEIPLPSLDRQRELVEAWRGLREMKEENERIAEPLESLCRSYLQDLKYKYPLCAIGPYIEPCDARNSDLTIKLSQGIANSKVFQAPKQVAENSRSDKIVRKGQFAYNRATTRNGEKISIAYREGEDCTVSSAYQVFYINDEDKLNPYFLWLWFKRSEFDRYARYMSKGSAHEFFEFDEMCRVEIPLPPIEVQRAIVDIYRCANECRKIAAEANSLSTTICPSLIQKIING